MADNEGRPAYIDLLSLNSAAAEKVRMAAREKQIEAARRNRPMEDDNAVMLRVLAACTKAWHLVGIDGGHIDVPCNEAAAAEFYSTPDFYFARRQAIDFADNAGNFLPGSSMT